ncbi:unnamed protein product, partial [Laminaria digitata]
EVSYKGSPTNLKTHLNTQYPGHQEAYADVQRQTEKEHGRRMGGSVVGSGSIGAGASTGDATLTVQPTIGQFFSSRTTSWHQALVRWMAMAAIPFSQRAHAYVCKYFQTYVQTQLQCHAICKLCLEQEQLGRAEVSYKGSPTNLKTHLNTQSPGHQEAYADVQRQKEKEHGRRMGGSVVGSGSIGAGASTGDATLTVQPTIGQFFSS